MKLSLHIAIYLLLESVSAHTSGKTAEQTFMTVITQQNAVNMVIIGKVLLVFSWVLDE